MKNLSIEVVYASHCKMNCTSKIFLNKLIYVNKKKKKHHFY